ncbi:hypothetical protein EON63_13260 [archaeon]|nr:MAG: hypothetical protein EON63_13260 [archaeon]
MNGVIVWIIINCMINTHTTHSHTLTFSGGSFLLNGPISFFSYLGGLLSTRDTCMSTLPLKQLAFSGELL